jgi:hypothetical protein
MMDILHFHKAYYPAGASGAIPILFNPRGLYTPEAQNSYLSKRCAMPAGVTILKKKGVLSK